MIDTSANLAGSAPDLVEVLRDAIPLINEWVAKDRLPRLANLEAAFLTAQQSFDEAIDTNRATPRTDDENEGIKNADRDTVPPDFTNRYGRNWELESQGSSHLHAKLRKRRTTGAVEAVPLGKALPCTTMVGDNTDGKLATNVAFVVDGKKLTKARLKDSPLAYVYHLRVLLMSYVLVAEPAKPEDKPWLNLGAALNAFPTLNASPARSHVSKTAASTESGPSKPRYVASGTANRWPTPVSPSPR